METGEPRSFEQYYPPLDAWFDVRVTPNDDGLSVYFHDITDRVRAEQEREAALDARPSARDRAACRSSAPRAPGWPGTLEVDELLRHPRRRRAQRLRRGARRSRSTSGALHEIATRAVTGSRTPLAERASRG